MFLNLLFGVALLGAPVNSAIAPPGAAEQIDEPAATAADTPKTAQPNADTFAEAIEVQGREGDLVGLAAAASEGITGRIDLAKRPILRPGELVETTPGVIATQHSGGGKANQYFLRGMNLDHGTDFSVAVDGVPVNMPSHGHGQGYADLNFLIPEIVEAVLFRKGPYSAEHGDFSSAGGVDLELVDDFDAGFLSLTAGSFDLARLLWADSRKDASGGKLATAVEGFHQDGPWQRGDDYRGGKTFLRYSRGDAQRGFSLTALGYDASWLATDQVPRRAIESGRIDRFGLIDAGPRGDTARYSLSLRAHRSGDQQLDDWQLYAIHYDFGLISNFTYFLEDPVNGDQFEQADHRWVFGGSLSRRWASTVAGRPADLAAGLQLRHDRIANGLFRTSELRRWSTVRQDNIDQTTGGPWSEATLSLSPHLRARLGLRADVYSVAVDSRLDRNSGSADDLILSPKLALIFGPWQKTEIYLDLGTGHHSNDARGAVIRVDPVSGEPVPRVDPLVRSRGIDIGVRSTALPGLHTTLTLFQLELDSELLFVGDGGSTEASRPSRRRGIEWTNFWRFAESFTADFDLTLTDAEFRDEDPAGNYIPGALRETIAAGLTWQGERLSGALRWRYFGGGVLIEDGSVAASSTSLVNGQLGLAVTPRLRCGLEVFNLLGSEASDIEYFYTSRLPGEPEPGVEDVHLHPLESRSARLTLTWRL